ncbi:UNVERIFIED_CONTAM: hypothetical protein Sindi_0048800 [Sesamum indicum]
MSGERLIPNWAISISSSVLRTRAGQDSWELYRAACLERNLVISAQTSYTAVQENFAHNITQAIAFGHNLSLQCSMWRHEKIQADAKVADLERKLVELRDMNDALRSESEQKLAELTRQLEEAMSSAQRDRRATFESGKEQGFEAGREARTMEGHTAFLQSSEYQDAITQARMHDARDFMKTRTFREVVETKATSFMTLGFDKCQDQIHKLQGFVGGLYHDLLDPALVGNLEPYPAEEEAPPAHDEFAASQGEVDQEPNPSQT